MVEFDEEEKILEEEYNKFVDELSGLYWDIMNKKKRMRYINALLDRTTGETEEIVKEFFKISQKKGDIPKDLKYSRENFVKALAESYLIE